MAFQMVANGYGQTRTDTLAAAASSSPQVGSISPGRVYRVRRSYDQILITAITTNTSGAVRVRWRLAQGIEPAIFPLPDNRSYLLSHCRPLATSALINNGCSFTLLLLLYKQIAPGAALPEVM